MTSIRHIDCTLRDGGYYNAWDFAPDLVKSYLAAIKDAGVTTVELGLRSLENSGFKGPFAFTSDEVIQELGVPAELEIGVMVNAKELLGAKTLVEALERLFPCPATESPVDLVRIACHVHEFVEALPAANWLKARGYAVGFNLMQVADRSEDEVVSLAEAAAAYPLDVLYFADSLGSMDPAHTARLIGWLRKGWSGALGIHTHDNMGMALQNTLQAIAEGVTWVDSTVTGMGRGPGNARTEELVVELADRRDKRVNLIPLASLIRRHFKPMQHQYGWGTNLYYYLAGKYGIHPSFIQEMLSDTRYDDEDIIAVIERLRESGGKKFSFNALDAARQFFKGEPAGKWQPAELIGGREVLLLGTGPGVSVHRKAIESYIRQARPLVMALNTQTAIEAELIDLRVACHPVRLLADCEVHARLPQPLVTPASMLPTNVMEALRGKHLYDFGLAVQADTFAYAPTHCTVPTSLVVAYALAVATSGRASRILMAGFDGYGGDDPRNREMNKLIKLYQKSESALELVAVTPSRYELSSQSIYGLRPLA